MITQSEADILISLEKSFRDPKTIEIPAGQNNAHELTSTNSRELFIFDIAGGSLKLSKVRYQTRGRQTVILVRLDIDGPPTHKSRWQKNK